MLRLIGIWAFIGDSELQKGLMADREALLRIRLTHSAQYGRELARSL